MAPHLESINFSKRFVFFSGHLWSLFKVGICTYIVRILVHPWIEAVRVGQAGTGAVGGHINIIFIYYSCVKLGKVIRWKPKLNHFKGALEYGMFILCKIGGDVEGEQGVGWCLASWHPRHVASPQGHTGCQAPSANEDTAEVTRVAFYCCFFYSSEQYYYW